MQNTHYLGRAPRQLESDMRMCLDCLLFMTPFCRVVNESLILVTRVIHSLQFQLESSNFRVTVLLQ